MERKKRLVLAGFIIAMMLSTSSAFAEDGANAYYKNIVKSELVDVPPEEFSVLVQEVLQKDVDAGHITKQQAKQLYSEFQSKF